MVHAAQNRCFGCGPANPIGLRMEFLLAPDGGVVCEMTVPALYEGPPGLVHGGMIATMLDEIMSKTVRALGIRAVTRKMEVEYLRPVHSGVVLRLEARLVRKEGRKHWTEAKLLDTEGMVRAQSSGLFVEIPGPIQL
jgi:uncharacterized protein (TIGR00369 family)